MGEERYQHIFRLIPAEILLDVFSFTTGVELSKFRQSHEYFRQMIDCYTKSLPVMAIQKLNIVMDRDKYLDKIVMHQTANRIIEFNTFPELMTFIRIHPMPINTLNLWNTIWVSTSMLAIAETVPIGQVNIRHNHKSRFYNASGHGQIVFRGQFRRMHRPNCELLMADLMHHIRAMNKHRRQYFMALNFFPPNNFGCSSIYFGSDEDESYSSNELIDWVVEKANVGCHLLIIHRYSFVEPFDGLVRQILMKIPKMNYSGRLRIQPFTLLIKHMTPGHSLQPTIVDYKNGTRFLAGFLRFDETRKMHFLAGTVEEEEILLPDELKMKMDGDEEEGDEENAMEMEDEHGQAEQQQGKQFDCIIQLKQIGENDEALYAGPSTSAGIC